MISDNDRYNSSLSLLFDYYNIDSQNTNFQNYSFTLEDFTNKKIDALAAFRSNEAFLLLKQNYPFHTIDPSEYGFSTSAINLFTTTKNLQNNPQQVRKILEATKKGWEYALDNLNEVAELIHTKYRQDLSLEHLKYEAKLTKELMATQLFDIGEINEDFLYKTLKHLKKRELLNQNQHLDHAVFNLLRSYRNELTQEEKEWVLKHPTVRYTTKDFPPLSIIKGDSVEGVLADYLQYISQNTGLKFELTPSSSWDDMLNKFHDHQVDMIPTIGLFEDGKTFGLYSDTVETYPMVVVTDKRYRFIDSLSDLESKTIAVPKNSITYRFISINYPNIKIIVTDGIDAALKLVADQKADAYLGHSAVTLYHMTHFPNDQLQVSGNLDIFYKHKYLVQRDQQILLSIINKTLRNLPTEHKNVIHSKWLHTMVAQKLDLTPFILLGAFMFLLILFLVYRQRVLQKHQKQTQELNERIQLALEGSKSGIWEWNLLNNAVYFSTGWQKIAGYSDKEFPKNFEAWKNLIHPDDRDVTIQTIEQAIHRKMENFHAIFRMQHKNLSWIWLSSSAKVYFNDDATAIKVAGIHTDITLQKEVQEKLLEQTTAMDHLVHHDPLTGLANRILFNDRFNEAIKNAKRNNTKLALLFIDLDHFKEINDSLGHAVGDQLLKTVTSKLQVAFRKSDSIARLGGDEFALLSKDIQHIDNASKLATKVLEILSEAITLNGSKFYISCSIGISIFPDDGKTTEDLLKYADAAMYRAKNEGRNNFQFYSSEMTELAFERVIMESALRDAIKNEEFVVYYQPQVDARYEKMIGLEALVRWKHPKMGIIPPSKFIPLAESTGLVIELDQLVMKMAMLQLVKWKKMGLNPGKLSINVSVKQLQGSQCIPKLKELISLTGCEYENIELEITESEVMRNPENAIEILEQIHQLGVKLSIDDFGTGYSSLAYLKRLPINKLKIDRSFIKDLPDDEEDKAITKTIIALANNLGLDLIAEGIETKAQKDFVLNHGCNNIQGYYYYEPLPANEIEKVLRNE